jgi:hypothetical protein
MQWQALTLGGLSPADVMRSLVEEWTKAPGCPAAVDNARVAVSLDAHEWAAAWLEAAERSQLDAGEFARCVGDARDFAPSAGHPRVAAILARVPAR